jgi:hypothetical protein
MNLDTSKWFESASQVALAFFGGLIGALMRREASSWQTALLGAAGAGFVGLLVAKFCAATGVSDDMTFVFVGVAGWLGASRTIDFLETLIEKQLGVRLPRADVPQDVGHSRTETIDDAPILERQKDEIES